MKLSLCMIVKNEEKYLDECLASVRDYVDEMIILDTGSTDNTLDIARNYNTQIYQFDWINDFSAARNASIQYAKGDWILWLDADERLIEPKYAQLRKKLTTENKPIAYLVEIHNYLADGKNYKISHAHRLFRNNQGIAFSGRIHEQIAPSVTKLGGEERHSGVVLEHFGYGLQGTEKAKKDQRNRELLMQMVEEAPESAYAHYTIAQHYGLTGKPELADTHYKKALQLDQFNPRMTASLLNTMSENLIALKKYTQAEKYSRKSVQLFDEQVGAYLNLYRIADKISKHEQAILALESLIQNNKKLKNNAKPSALSTDIIIDETMLTEMLGLSCIKNGDAAAGRKHLEQLPESFKKSIETLKILSDLYIAENNYEPAAKVMEQLYQLDKDPKILEMLGTIHIKLENFTRAIELFQQLAEIFPHNQMIIKRLAGLFAKTGQVQKSYTLLNMMAMSN